jgi:uncharacterized membrane protein (UPF0182 family)
VEPIYLKAETAAYPELRLVAVMHNDNLSYAESFDQALAGLLSEGEPQAEPQMQRKTDMEGWTHVEYLVREASDAFDNYLKFLGQKRFEEASGALKRLENSLNDLLGETKAT